MSEKKMAIEDLARMVKAGFDETATKHEVRTGFQLLTDSLDLVRQDVHDIKLTLGPLVRHAAAMEEKVLILEKRIMRVERKVGIAK